MKVMLEEITQPKDRALAGFMPDFTAKLVEQRMKGVIESEGKRILDSGLIETESVADIAHGIERDIISPYAETIGNPSAEQRKKLFLKLEKLKEFKMAVGRKYASFERVVSEFISSIDWRLQDAYWVLCSDCYTLHFQRINGVASKRGDSGRDYVPVSQKLRFSLVVPGGKFYLPVEYQNKPGLDDVYD